MQQTKNTPTFNMKAVVRETGLKPDTLRAWERRYGLPDPGRSEGKHRLYSQRDIDTLKWLMLRQQEGMSISHAVELYHRLEAEGQDPLLVRSQAIPAASVVTASPLSISGGKLADFRREWVAACKDFDEFRSEQVLAEAFALYSPEQVCFELLRAGVHEVGEGWYRGETTVQQEHFTSELAIRRLEAMVAASPRPTRPGRILVACPAGEEHTFGPLLISFILRRNGWDVTYLGANVPVDQLVATLSVARPNLVVLSAQLLITAASLRRTAIMLQGQNIPLAFGGRIFNLISELRERIPGRFLGDDLEETAETVEQIMIRPFAWPEIKKVSAEYEDILAQYQDRRAAIEGAVWTKMASSNFPIAQLQEANGYFSRNIVAALYLGEVKYLDVEIDWIKDLLLNRNLELSLLPAYIQAYREAINENLDERRQPLVDWLSKTEADLA